MFPAVALLGCKSETPANERSSSSPRKREVQQVIDAQKTIEGAGVHLRRSLGSRLLPMLDPFLMLDEFHSDDPADYIAGFPSHPHRGFETVTYMIAGAMDHRDSLGNHGRLGPGSTQWMTAGRGIIHSEMPTRAALPSAAPSADPANGSMWGFQLWVNLPSTLKMTKPRYQDLAPDRIVRFQSGDARMGLIAGEAQGRRGPVDGIVTAPLMLDVTLPARASIEHSVPATHNAFAYVFQGSALFGAARKRVSAGQLAVLGPGEIASVASDDGGRFLLLAGRPIGEPVARGGPFVMNTQNELQKAFEDYRTGQLVDG